MRPVHILGLGLLVGMTALGAMLAVVAYRWQETTFPPEQVTGAPPGQTPGAPGPAAPQEVAQGMALFQQRCAPCHSIGGGRRVGPDLASVTDRRERDWIIGFIVNPDEAFARNDPIATQLLQEYGVRMPDTGTSEAEASTILAYIQSESGGGGAAPKPSGGTPGAPAKPGATPGAGAAAGGNASAGQAVFQQNCSSCHPGGNQGVGPALRGRGLPAELVTTTVRQGRGAMPAFSPSQINDQQLADLAAYVQSLR